jgi:hypothetical protein
MTVADSIKAQLDEAEAVIRQQMARIAELEQENERLKEGLSAHGVLKSIYSDETQPTGHRIKAAIGSARQNALCPQSASDLSPIDVLPAIADGRSRNGSGSE